MSDKFAESAGVTSRPPIARVGLVVPNRYEQPLRAYLDLIADGERLGYGTAWVTEVAGADAVGLACAAAVGTSTIRIAIGVLSVFTRTVPLLAMSAATLRSLAGPRAVMGLGTSTPNIVSGWHGLPFAAPVQRLAETATGIRAIMAGEGRRVEGRTVRSEGFTLAIEGEVSTPIHVAALGPRNAARAAAYADGIIFTLCTPAELMNLATSVRADAGRPIEVTSFVRVAVTDRRAAALTWMRRELAWYASAAAYRQHFARQGFEDQMQRAQQAWEERNFAGAQAVIDDEMCEALAAVGTAEEVAEQLLRHLDAGADNVSCYFMDLGGGLQEVAAQLSALGQAQLLR